MDPRSRSSDAPEHDPRPGEPSPAPPAGRADPRPADQVEPDGRRGSLETQSGPDLRAYLVARAGYPPTRRGELLRAFYLLAFVASLVAVAELGPGAPPARVEAPPVVEAGSKAGAPPAGPTGSLSPVPKQEEPTAPEEAVRDADERALAGSEHAPPSAPAATTSADEDSPQHTK